MRPLHLLYKAPLTSLGLGAVAPMYVSECSPKDVRGRITGCFQIMVCYFTNFLFFLVVDDVLGSDRCDALIFH